MSASLMALASLVFLPAAALAQSAIAGVVKDTTGAVLPGVTVEAASPALIEKVRTVVTDDQGQYKIVDLRPGTFTVTFTLAGFSTVKREGLELPTNFTAQVNAELRVGAIAETVTVSGQSPVVDVQSTVGQAVISSSVRDAIPTGRSFQHLGALIPGMSVAGGQGAPPQDVGGSVQANNLTLAIHGSKPNDFTEQVDGFTFNTMVGHTGNAYTPNGGTVQEYSYQLGAIPAEISNGGVAVNLIPKEGGNTFAGSFFGTYANHSLQTDNLTDELRARGLTSVNKLDRVWDWNPSFGGPLIKDKLWFHGAFRSWGTDAKVAGQYYNKTPEAFVYTPDLSRPAVENNWWRKENLRLTWQISQKNKLAVSGDQESACQCHHGIIGNQGASEVLSPEAARAQAWSLNYMLQAKWTAPVTNRILLEAGISILRQNISRTPSEPSAANPNNNSILEQSTSFRYRADSIYQLYRSRSDNYKASLSYVTGSHALKTGIQWLRGWLDNPRTVNGDMNFIFFNGVPRAVEVWATPLAFRADMNADLGLYAQDQWTLKRLTLNLGIRYDYFNASVPEQHQPPARFVGPRDFAEVRDVPKWNDLNPRLGAAYDLFGNGKTALKVALSRYVAADTVGFALNNNPLQTSVNSATRTWTDANGDFIPQENELGPLSNANFGKVVLTTRYDDAVREGFGSRAYNWETSAGIQHELLPRVAVNATYFRRWYGNFTATDNLLVTSADYAPFCITAPVDPRLPGGGGNQNCGLYDINPANFGKVDNLITVAKKFGTQTEVYDGVDLTMNARFAGRALVQGGLNVGRSATNNCFVVDSPQQLQFCDVKPPFQPQVKLLGSYPLPWDLQASATFQSIPGPQITASYVATSAQIRPSLGRNLSSGANGTATVGLIAPGTMYEKRLNQLDLRLSKIFRMGRIRIQGNFDLYNALNASTILSLNTRYGPSWLQPSYILPGRLFKFGAQIDF